MDEFEKCMLIDRLLIFFGILGVVVPVVALIMALNGMIVMQVTHLFVIPIGAFFVYYGFKMIKKDKETYNRK